MLLGGLEALLTVTQCSQGACVMCFTGSANAQCRMHFSLEIPFICIFKMSNELALKLGNFVIS